jgi:NAD(P)-dependent dehydrogenase (short-subunit alcohol dehydrogenase family)
VVAIDRDPQALAWTREHPRVTEVTGDAGFEAVAARAADVAEQNGTLAGWVNNAAVFRGGSACCPLSSHQAQRPVRGAMAYATAKVAIDGLTRALAVDYGPRWIRTNGVALGSIATGRYEALVVQRPGVEDQVRALHPLGRAGHVPEVATVVAHLLSPAASYVNGAIVPVDGGRAVLGADPEARELGA